MTSQVREHSKLQSPSGKSQHGELDVLGVPLHVLLALLGRVPQEGVGAAKRRLQNDM
jgi:hypothetical protein